MALHCERCGQENAQDARFCRLCGAQVASLGTDPALVKSTHHHPRKVAVKTLLAQLGAAPHGSALHRATRSAGPRQPQARYLVEVAPPRTRV